MTKPPTYEEPTYEDLADQLLDLWQDQVAGLAEDADLADLMRRQIMMASQVNPLMAPLMGQMMGAAGTPDAGAAGNPFAAFASQPWAMSSLAMVQAAKAAAGPEAAQRSGGEHHDGPDSARRAPNSRSQDTRSQDTRSQDTSDQAAASKTPRTETPVSPSDDTGINDVANLLRRIADRLDDIEGRLDRLEEPGSSPAGSNPGDVATDAAAGSRR